MPKCWLKASLCENMMKMSICDPSLNYDLGNIWCLNVDQIFSPWMLHYKNNFCTINHKNTLTKCLFSSSAWKIIVFSTFDRLYHSNIERERAVWIWLKIEIFWIFWKFFSNLNENPEKSNFIKFQKELAEWVFMIFLWFMVQK